MTSTVLDFFEFDLRPAALLRRFAWSITGFAILRAKGILTLPLALWILGASGYGKTTAVMAAAWPIAAIALLNIPDGAGRLVVSASSPEIAEARVRRIRRLAIFVALFLVVIGATLGVGLHSFVIGWAAVSAGCGVVFKAGAIHLEYFQRMATLTRFRVISEYTAAVGGLGLAVWIGATGMVFAAAAVSVLAGVIAWRTIKIPASLPEDDASFWRPALRLSLPLLPVALAQWALFSIDALLIYGYLGQRPTGAYSAAYSIGSVAMLLPVGINAVWFPTAQRLRSRDRVQLRRIAIRVAHMLLALGLAVIAVALLLAPLLSHVLTASVYGSVPRCVLWIVVGFTALGFCKLFEGLIYAAGQPRWIVIAYSTGAVANILLNVWWIQSYGIVGAAWATAAGYGLTAVLLAPRALQELRK